MIKEQGFFPLSVLVPPMLETAFGYPPTRGSRPGEAGPRFVAFYWEQGGDEAAYSDGQQAGIGTLNNDAYLAFVQHRTIRPKLADYTLGASDASASHWLVLDREEPRQLYVALASVARRFLERQWGEPPQEAATLQFKDVAELKQFVAQMLNRTQTIRVGSTATAMQALQEQWQRAQELKAWLDANA